jgi:hypothetical protein
MKPLPNPPMVAVEYFAITAGRSNLMARFDADGRLAEWTSSIRRASLFVSAEAGAAAIRAICSAEIDAAVRAGKAVREEDPETGETVVMDYRGRVARPYRTPSIRLQDGERNIEDEIGPARGSVRQFVRGAFAEAKHNPTRQSEARISPRSGDEYATPLSRRGRLAAMAAHIRP